MKQLFAMAIAGVFLMGTAPAFAADNAQQVRMKSAMPKPPTRKATSARRS